MTIHTGILELCYHYVQINKRNSCDDYPPCAAKSIEVKYCLLRAEHTHATCVQQQKSYNIGYIGHFATLHYNVHFAQHLT